MPPARPSDSPLPDLLLALRPHQWVKNLLLFVPLVLAHEIDRAARLSHIALAFIAFCLCASGTYVFNDLRDRVVDRDHPVKRRRPFAAGRLSSRVGVLLTTGLFVAGLGLSALMLPTPFTAMLLLYAVLTTLYSLWLKRKLLLDVFTLAGLYTLRVLAGGASGGFRVSEWLLAFCIFFFLGLAFAKRYAELLRVSDAAGAAESATNAQFLASSAPSHPTPGVPTPDAPPLGPKVPGRAYHVEDLAVIEAVGPASGYLSVLVMALYVSSTKATQLYRSPVLLWLLCPVLLYWVTRLWFVARRRKLDEDPILYALKDPVSLTTIALAAALVGLAWLGVPGLT